MKPLDEYFTSAVRIKERKPLVSWPLGRGRKRLPEEAAAGRKARMNIGIGRMVHYVLSAQDALEINRRRTNGLAIAERIKPTWTPADGAAGHGWPIGAQAHIGNTVEAGMEFPALCVRDWKTEGIEFGPQSSANFQVFLDGTDVYWALSKVEETNTDKKQPSTPGTWHWPARE
jgi:hypothetical protein